MAPRHLDDFDTLRKWQSALSHALLGINLVTSLILIHNQLYTLSVFQTVLGNTFLGWPLFSLISLLVSLIIDALAVYANARLKLWVDEIANISPRNRRKVKVAEKLSHYNAYQIICCVMACVFIVNGTMLVTLQYNLEDVIRHNYLLMSRVYFSDSPDSKIIKEINEIHIRSRCCGVQGDETSTNNIDVWYDVPRRAALLKSVPFSCCRASKKLEEKCQIHWMPINFNNINEMKEYNSDIILHSLYSAAPENVYTADCAKATTQHLTMKVLHPVGFAMIVQGGLHLIVALLSRLALISIRRWFAQIELFEMMRQQ